MFKVDNSKIGTYLGDLIEKQYKSQREFARTFISLQNAYVDEDAVTNMANRLSQIKKGAKGVQLSDLPILSELLNVSIEQIVSAGESVNGPSTKFPTNRTIAQSHNKEDWDSYINNPNNPVANADEYNKTILDYAVEFGNYELIKYFTDSGIVWFYKEDGKRFWEFGAGTTIKRRHFEYIDYAFEGELTWSEALRYDIIKLAARNGDIKMLKDMHAREISDYYDTNPFVGYFDFSGLYDRTCIEEISQSSKRVLDYFLSPFTMTYNLQWKNKDINKQIFLFPFYSQLLDALIKNKHPDLEKYLEIALKHNENTKNRVNDIIKNAGHPDYVSSYIYKKNNLVTCLCSKNCDGIATNVIHITKKSTDKKIQTIINKINKLYDFFLFAEERKEYERYKPYERG